LQYAIGAWGGVGKTSLRPVVFNLEVVFFLGDKRTSRKNVHNYFSILYFVCETIFVVAEIIGSPRKMKAYFFIQIVLSVMMTITEF